MESFGLLVGIGSFITSCVGLFVWPMQEWIVYEMQGNWYIGNVIILCFQAISLAWPAWLYFGHETETFLCTPTIMNNYLRQFRKLTKIERLPNREYDFGKSFMRIKFDIPLHSPWEQGNGSSCILHYIR